MHMGHDSLTKQLETFRAGMLARLPARDRSAILHAAEDLRASAETRKTPAVGEAVPRFALPDQHGRLVRLEDRLAHGPVVLLFIRGGWCPFCTLTLRAYQAALPAMQAAGGDLLAITPQPLGSCGALAERDLLSFPVLSDCNNTVSDAYGVAYDLAPALRDLYRRLGHDLPRVNGTGDWRLPLPATIIVAPDGTVVQSHVEPVAHRRLEPEVVVETLRRLSVDA